MLHIGRLYRNKCKPSITEYFTGTETLHLTIPSFVSVLRLARRMAIAVGH